MMRIASSCVCLFCIMVLLLVCVWCACVCVVVGTSVLAACSYVVHVCCVSICRCLVGWIILRVCEHCAWPVFVAFYVACVMSVCLTRCAWYYYVARCGVVVCACIVFCNYATRIVVLWISCACFGALFVRVCLSFLLHYDACCCRAFGLVCTFM